MCLGCTVIQVNTEFEMLNVSLLLQSCTTHLWEFEKDLPSCEMDPTNGNFLTQPAYAKGSLSFRKYFT